MFFEVCRKHCSGSLHGLKRIGYNINIMRQSACLVFNLITVNNFPSLIARGWVGRQTQWWPWHKAIYFSWLEPELFCLLVDPPGFSCWFSIALVFQWCCLTLQGFPGVGRNTLFLSSPHLCFIIVFICDLFVSRDDPLMKTSCGPNNCMFWAMTEAEGKVGIP